MRGRSVLFQPVQLLLAALTFFLSVNAATSVANTILVFAKDAPSGYHGTSGLAGHGIPYQLVIVPQAGVTLPTLNSSLTSGNYGGIIVLSEVSYDYGAPTGFASALTTAQWNQLFAYQTTFGVRMVRLDVFPGAGFGKFLPHILRQLRCH
jgi:hypothetical protein